VKKHEKNFPDSALVDSWPHALPESWLDLTGLNGFGQKVCDSEGHPERRGHCRETVACNSKPRAL